jgi:NADH-quinone oxidoreductase subunit A
MDMKVLALGAYLVVVGALVAFLTVITHLLGERHYQKSTGIPYESGILPTGSARVRFSADFYLIAVFFVIFDVSAIFVFAWAVAARELGWPGYAAIVAFVLETAAGLAYLWRMGAFDWGARRLAAHKKRHGLDSASKL